MCSQKLKAKSLLISTSGTSTNISINRTSKYLIYVHVVGAPKQSKIENWGSVACWFSHIFSTRLSRLLDKDVSFEDAYVKAMAAMDSDLRKHYNQSDIDKIKLNFICVLPTDDGARVYHGGEDFAIFQIRSTSKLVFAESCDTVRCDVTTIPKVDIIPNAYSVTVFNYAFLTACTFGKHFTDMCNLDHNSLDHKVQYYISENKNKYIVAYCTMHIEK